MSNEKTLEKIVEAIKKEKAKANPDKAQLKALIKSYREAEEDICEFTGEHNDNPIRCPRKGWRSPSFGKWYNNDM